MNVRRWLAGLSWVVVAATAGACGNDDQEMIDELCAKWDQCFPDQNLGFCIFEEAVESCENTDEFIDHFESCVDMTCDQLSFDCLMGLPNCDDPPSKSSPRLPWLPRDDDEYVIDSPPVPGSSP